MVMSSLKEPTDVEVSMQYLATESLVHIIINMFIDIDECSGINQCQQLCINTEGSFTCNCTEGFTLESDERNCTGKISVDSENTDATFTVMCML